MEEPSFKKSPVSLEEVFQDLAHKGEDKNFLEREAVKAGVDFDERDKGEPDYDLEAKQMREDEEEQRGRDMEDHFTREPETY